MKKLTAGIFATILGVTAMGAADAAVTSKGYVDAAVGTVAQSVTDLGTTVSNTYATKQALEGEVTARTNADTTLQGNIDTLAGNVYKKTETYTQAEVDAAIAAVDGAESVQALTARVTTAEGEIDALQTKTTGLGSAAYTESTAYATASQGAKADATAATVAGYGDIVTHNVAEFATAAQGALAATAVQPAAIDDMATKTWVGEQDYATENFVTTQGYLKSADLATYATKTEAQGYANAKDAAIAEAKQAGTDAAAAAATADDKAEAAQAAAEAAQATADAAIKAPAACSDPTNMCVLVSNGTTVSWQVIANVYPDNNGTLN